MGLIRNGARTYLDVVAKACKLSHFPGFRSGLRTILGPEDADSLYVLWTPFCDFVEALVATDNWYNRKDAVDESPGAEGEDLTLV
jgi:hypothetical protein